LRHVKSYYRKSHLKRNIFIFLTLVSIAGVSVVILTIGEPYFSVKDIQIRGEERLSEEEIKSWVGVLSQKSIFHTDLKGIAQNISSKPQIKRVEIRRVLPSTIIINVEERKPFACIVYKGVYYEVDDEGVIIGRRRKVQGLPLIIGLNSLSETEKVKRGVRVLNFSKDSGFFFSKVNIKDENNIVGYLKKEDIEIYIDKGERLNYLSCFPFILSDAENEGKKIKYIDIRFHNQIAVVLKTGK